MCVWLALDDGAPGTSSGAEMGKCSQRRKAALRGWRDTALLVEGL